MTAVERLFQWFTILIVAVLILNSCATTVLMYSGDVYQANECISRNASIIDYQEDGKLFFYDPKGIGHLLIGEIEVRNSTDTLSIKRYI